MTIPDAAENRRLLVKLVTLWLCVALLFGLIAWAIVGVYGLFSGSAFTYLLIYGSTEVWTTVLCVQTWRDRLGPRPRRRWSWRRTR